MEFPPTEDLIKKMKDDGYEYLTTIKVYHYSKSFKTYLSSDDTGYYYLFGKPFGNILLFKTIKNPIYSNNPPICNVERIATKVNEVDAKESVKVNATFDPDDNKGRYYFYNPYQ